MLTKIFMLTTCLKPKSTTKSTTKLTTKLTTTTPKSTTTTKPKSTTTTKLKTSKKPKSTTKSTTSKKPKSKPKSTSTKSSDWDVFMSEFNSDAPIVTTSVRAELVATELMPTISTYSANTMKKYIVGGDIVDMSLDQEITFNDKNTGRNCHLCDCRLFPSRNMLICSGCGVEAVNHANTAEEEYSTSAITECNVHSEGFLAFKMTGRGSYGLQRSILKTCASYTKYRKSNTLKDMKNWNVHSKKHHIPKNVIKEANDMFAIIKTHGYVFRKDGKKGVLSACLYYACYNNGISKTPSEIAQFSDIEEKFHSFGDRVLHDLNERGVIEIPTKVAPIRDYVNRYMILLDIDTKYTPFVLDLIARAEKKQIHILHDSKNCTKCVGAIYMLINRVPELRKRITKEMIEKECGLSKTTFIRYYNMLGDYYKKLKKVFKRHQITMPATWR